MCYILEHCALQIIPRGVLSKSAYILLYLIIIGWVAIVGYQPTVNIVYAAGMYIATCIIGILILRI